MGELLNVLPGDVGRPMEHLSTQFDVSELLREARAVLETLAPKETRVMSQGGSWYLRRMVCQQTGDHRSDGVVISFAAISAQPAAQ